ncbi:MAG: hypothetical protein KAU62_10435 [Candidatus Heimdallarchaeota archaeon]|nr:hypothetical protein [Candidatus Heimdallarchaeota archaeon]MCK4611561.1 hypothetical protein [Candidatus Heimdallarchaeota archaeon]
MFKFFSLNSLIFANGDQVIDLTAILPEDSYYSDVHLNAGTRKYLS